MGLFDPNQTKPGDPCPRAAAAACDWCRQVRTLQDALYRAANMARVLAATSDAESRLNGLRRLWKEAMDAANAAIPLTARAPAAAQLDLQARPVPIPSDHLTCWEARCGVMIARWRWWTITEGRNNSAARSAGNMVSEAI
jgi:hypothetical protein